jgi:leader peptidase (prepilin peptidase)/N-methyltransferase
MGSSHEVARAPLLIVLAAAIVLDLTSLIVPNVLTVPALAYALVLAAILDHPGLGEALMGVTVVGGSLALMAALSRGGLGGGDVKLGAVLGAALGWQPALVAFVLSQVVGLAIVLMVSLARRELVRGPVPVGALMALFGAILLVAVR